MRLRCIGFVGLRQLGSPRSDNKVREQGPTPKRVPSPQVYQGWAFMTQDIKSAQLVLRGSYGNFSRPQHTSYVRIPKRDPKFGSSLVKSRQVQNGSWSIEEAREAPLASDRNIVRVRNACIMIFQTNTQQRMTPFLVV